jgi:hypothetical protein
MVPMSVLEQFSIAGSPTCARTGSDGLCLVAAGAERSSFVDLVASAAVGR